MDAQRLGAVVFTALIITSGGVAALQYTIYDEYDTNSELSAHNGITNAEVVNDSVQSLDSGGFSDGFSDGDFAEYSTVDGFSAVDQSGDYVAVSSPSETNNLVRSGDAIGDYGTYSFADSISDSSLEPYSVSMNWSNQGTVGSNATVNSNDNLELSDSDTYTGNSFTTSGDTTVDSVDVSVGSVGATVDVAVEQYNSSDGTWSTVNSKSVSSTGTTTLSVGAGSGEYRVTLTAQGDSTTATVIESTTVHATDPAGPVTLTTVDTAGTPDDLSDDTGLQIEVTPSGDVNLYKFTPSGGTTQLANATVSDTSVEHTYALDRKVSGNTALLVDGSEVATASASISADFNQVEVTASNGHTVDDLTAPTDESYYYFSQNFSNVSDAREGFVKAEIQPGTQFNAEVYGIDSEGVYHHIDTQTVTVASSESAVTKTVIANATDSNYQDYEVDFGGHGDVTVTSVGMTQETSGWLGGGSVDDATSGNGGIAIAGIVIAGVAALGFRRR